MAILVPIVILVGIIIFSVGGLLIDKLHLPFFNFGSGAPGKPAISVSPTSPIVLDTTIVEGPEEGEVLHYTAVTFKFSASATPEDIKERPIFETKIDGFDKEWITTASKERNITFPAGVQRYTFHVRSRTKDVIDTTPASRTFQVSTSPYFGEVSIESFKPTKDKTPFDVVLKSKLPENKPLDIGKWTLTSRWQGELVIAQGVEKFHPNLEIPQSNIVLQGAEAIYIKGEANPLREGINFRTNMCFGYLRVDKPKLPGPDTCPHRKPTVNEVAHLNPLCQEYILKKINFSSCVPPNFWDDQSVTNDSECVTYLTTLAQEFSYDFCYRRNVNDPSFTPKRWYIYYPNIVFGHPLHDVITLTDEEGLVVSQRIY